MNRFLLYVRQNCSAVLSTLHVIIIWLCDARFLGIRIFRRCAATVIPVISWAAPVRRIMRQSSPRSRIGIDGAPVHNRILGLWISVIWSTTDATLTSGVISMQTAVFLHLLYKHQTMCATGRTASLGRFGIMQWPTKYRKPRETDVHGETRTSNPVSAQDDIVNQLTKFPPMYSSRCGSKSGEVFWHAVGRFCTIRWLQELAWLRFHGRRRHVHHFQPTATCSCPDKARTARRTIDIRGIEVCFVSTDNIFIGYTAPPINCQRCTVTSDIVLCPTVTSCCHWFSSSAMRKTRSWFVPCSISSHTRWCTCKHLIILHATTASRVSILWSGAITREWHVHATILCHVTAATAFLADSLATGIIALARANPVYSFFQSHTT